LAGSWLLGRLARSISTLPPAWLALAADLLFPAPLVGLVALDIDARRNWRNFQKIVPLTVLGVANLLMHPS
jgi:uncharacterized protein involved in response to NO